MVKLEFRGPLALGGAAIRLRRNRPPANPPPANPPAPPTPTADPDDRRQAAFMAATIAGFVTTAALAIVAVVAAIVTYVASNFHHLGLFYGLAALATLLLVGAAYLGALGTAEITNRGYYQPSDWSPFTQRHLFDKQSFATMAGFFVLGAAVIVGFTSPHIASSDGPALRQLHNDLLAIDSALTSRIHKDLSAIGSELSRQR